MTSTSEKLSRSSKSKSLFTHTQTRRPAYNLPHTKRKRAAELKKLSEQIHIQSNDNETELKYSAREKYHEV